MLHPLLHNAHIITKCRNRYYKMRRYYKMPQNIFIKLDYLLLEDQRSEESRRTQSDYGLAVHIVSMY